MKDRKAFFLNDLKLPVKKCKRPSFKIHRGRTWDNGWIVINGIKTKAYLDTTWGHCIYFQMNEDPQWYTVKMYSKPEDDVKGKSYEIDPFAAKSTEIIYN